MERVGTLINKLKEQFDQQADAEKMAVTAQMLLAELQHNQVPPTIGSKISVVLPSVKVGAAELEVLPEPEQPSLAPASLNSWLFEPNAEIPTMAHQTVVAEPETSKSALAPVIEFNTVLARQSESHNDRLKEERVEVATALQAAPIRDLKKAIGINDRFLFVNDLFRGDENMYERSLKTINGFTIYPEAEYWIQRELKVKLSWPDDSESVKLFDQLVRRRFS